MDVVRSAEKKDMPKSRINLASIAIHNKPKDLPSIFEDQ